MARVYDERLGLLSIAQHTKTRGNLPPVSLFVCAEQSEPWGIYSWHRTKAEVAMHALHNAGVTGRSTAPVMFKGVFNDNNSWQLSGVGIEDSTFIISHPCAPWTLLFTLGNPLTSPAMSRVRIQLETVPSLCGSAALQKLFILPTLIFEGRASVSAGNANSGTCSHCFSRTCSQMLCHAINY